MAEEFARQGGLSLLEAFQYNSEGEIRQRAAHLLEHHLLPLSPYSSVKTSVQLVLLAEFVLIQNKKTKKTDIILCVAGRQHLMILSQQEGLRFTAVLRNRTHQRTQDFLFTLCHEQVLLLYLKSVFDTFLI